MSLLAGMVIAWSLTNVAPQPLMIGPIPLGDILLTDTADNFLVKDFQKAGLDLKQVEKQMNGWKGYIIDKRIRRADGRWDWSPRPGQGKLLVEGRMSIELEVENSEKIEIALAQTELITNHINMVEGSNRAVSPLSPRLRHSIPQLRGSDHRGLFQRWNRTAQGSISSDRLSLRCDGCGRHREGKGQACKVTEFARLKAPPRTCDKIVASQEPEPSLYAATYRPVIRDGRPELDVWARQFALGEPLPTMPLRLIADYFVPVELELTYTETCRKRRLI
jgi:hypothetical protein